MIYNINVHVTLLIHETSNPGTADSMQSVYHYQLHKTLAVRLICLSIMCFYLDRIGFVKINVEYDTVNTKSFVIVMLQDICDSFPRCKRSGKFMTSGSKTLLLLRCWEHVQVEEYFSDGWL